MSMPMAAGGAREDISLPTLQTLESFGMANGCTGLLSRWTVASSQPSILSIVTQLPDRSSTTIVSGTEGHADLQLLHDGEIFSSLTVPVRRTTAVQCPALDAPLLMEGGPYFVDCFQTFAGNERTWNGGTLGYAFLGTLEGPAKALANPSNPQTNPAWFLAKAGQGTLQATQGGITGSLDLTILAPAGVATITITRAATYPGRHGSPGAMGRDAYPPSAAIAADARDVGGRRVYGARCAWTNAVTTPTRTGAPGGAMASYNVAELGVDKAWVLGGGSHPVTCAIGGVQSKVSINVPDVYY